ncbi:MAG: ATP-binding cassette domain-containing protein [Candidatus Delongbacteria bacterium]|jgi:putative ABC transport system ATP-binding protein|nr:ATP-binding cassette domain-containing protein [Candidatus Delongbacteria bacterium]
MKIQLKHIIPSPLTELPLQDSQLWRRDISFESNTTYLIYAPSGKGKTSLLHIMYGLRHDYDGQFSIDNDNAGHLDHKAWVNIRKHHISLVPQGLWLFDNLSGIENIRIKNRLTNHFSETEIQTSLDVCDMTEHQHKPANILSFGQKQRIAIVRALCQPFDFIFLDEAFSHLDNKNTEIVFEMIKNRAEKQHAGIILTSLSPTADGFDKLMKL